MRVSEIRTSELGEAERALWDGFLRPGGAPASAFMDWRFTRAVGDVRPDARIAVIEDDAGVAAFLPYHRRPMGLARPIGAPFSDQHGPVIRPGATPDLRAALKALGLSAYMHTAMPAEAAEAVGGDGPVFAESPAYVANVGDDPAGYLERKRTEHKTRFKAFGKRVRKTTRERGPAEMVLDDPDPAARDLTFALKRRQYRATGLHDVLAPRWVQAMFERLSARDEPDFGLRVASLRLNATWAAGEVCLLGAGSLHSWIVAYEPELADYSPGLQLLQEVIAQAPSLGVRRIDLGTGAGAYKSVFSDPEGRFLDGALCARGLAGAARRASLTAWSGVEAAPLGPLARLAGKVRRRGAQIAAVEPGLSGRARGVAGAVLGAPRTA